MASHLCLVLQRLEEMADEEAPFFHDAVPAAEREFFHRIAVANVWYATTYVALHDLHKADCLTLVREGSVKQVLTWEEWERLLLAHSQGVAALAGDEAAIKAVLDKEGIIQISYYQDRGATVVNHGPSAAEALAGRGDIPELVVWAIGVHELAFQCKPGTTNIGLIEKYFGDRSVEDIEFALLVNLCDQLGSLGTNGQPDIRPVLALLTSFRAYQAFLELKERLAVERLDKSKLEKVLADLKKSSDAFVNEDVDVAFDRIVSACAIPVYSEAKLREVLAPLVGKAGFTTDLLERVVMDLLNEGMISPELGKELKGANKAVRDAITKAAVPAKN